MADLFGAPLGFLAGGEEQRANVTNTMGALKAMGEIAQQPADLALKQAHARLFGAEAGLKEAEAADMLAMTQLEARFNAQGKNATAEDLAAEPGRPRSQADYMMQLADFAEQNGAPLRYTGKIRKDASMILEHEAIAGYRDAQRQREQQRYVTERQTRLSNAAAVAAESPQGYMNVLQDPELSQLLPTRQLSGDWNTDRRVLDTIAKAGQDSIRRARLVQQQTEVGLTAQRTQATVASAAASADLARARKDLVIERKNNLIKNGGETSPSAAEARREATAARKAATDAKLRKEFPSAPLDPGARMFNQTYTAADGKTRFVWMKDPVTGKGVGRVLDTGTAPAASRAAPAATDDEEED